MGNDKKKFRIVIVDNHPVLVAGLTKLIEGLKEFEVIATISDEVHFVEKIGMFNPDFIIINPDMIDFKKRNCTDELFHGAEGIKIAAIVYQYIDPEILKIFSEVITISDNKERIMMKLKRMSEDTEIRNDTGELSEREKEILVSVAKGMLNKEIADQFNLSIHTVITHRKNISRKTGIKSVSGLTVFAILNNLVDINDIE